MNDQDRTETHPSAEAVWWLVPIAFATAALAAVALSGNEPAEASALHASTPPVMNMPNAAPMAAAAGPVTVTPAAVATPAPAQPEIPTLEETERVPTF